MAGSLRPVGQETDGDRLMNRAWRIGIASATRGIGLMATVAVFLLLFSATGGGAEAYRLGPGDVLSISVWGHEELTLQAEVRPDGFLSFPLVGDVQADGLTPGELKEKLTRSLSAFVRDPNVTVVVAKFRTVRAQVLGAVARPGFYELPGNARVADLLASAGGPTEGADLEQAVLNQLGQEPSTVVRLDLARLLQQGDANLNFPLATGDLLFVPFQQKAVVLGEVRVPGTYTVKEGERVLDLLAAAGGLTPEADPARAVLTKGDRNAAGEMGAANGAGATVTGGSGISATSGATATMIIDLTRIQQNPSAPENIPVGAGDKLYVPRAREVVVVGQIRNPGMYRLTANTTVLDALALAGGALPNADLAHVTMTAPGGDTDGTVIDLSFKVDKTNATSRSAPYAPQTGPALRGGEVIFVPEADRGVMVLGQVRAPGRYDIKDGAKVLDLLGLAGGLMDNAGRTATLTRAAASGAARSASETSPASRVEVYDVDLAALLRHNDDSANIALKPGDVLFVPEGRWQVLVLGEVAKPGLYTFKEGDRLLDAIARAGGTTPQADLAAATLTVPSQEGPAQSASGQLASGQPGSAQSVLPLDLKALLAQKDPQMNRKLVGGEVIYVPEAKRQVLVLGEVARPGLYNFKEGDRLLDAIAMAGGTTPDADLRAATLTFSGQNMMRVDLAALMARSDPSAQVQNVELKGGEALYIPEAKRQVLVLGEVAKPGLYTFKEGDRLLDALALAGGPTAKADLKAASLATPAAIQPVDLKALMEQPNAAENPVLAGGETLYVPEARRQVLVLGEVTRPGLYDFATGDRLLDAIARAGGVTADADLRAATMTVKDGDVDKVIPLRLDSALRQESPEANLPLTNQAAIYVPKAKRQVLVLGEVARPGLYTFKDGDRVLDAIGMAGGLTDKADASNATLTLATSAPGEAPSQRLDLTALAKEPLSSLNRRLSGGETIMIPEAKRQVLVLGEVERPGVYTFSEGARLLDAVALAGGLTANADGSRATLTRRASEPMPVSTSAPLPPSAPTVGAVGATGAGVAAVAGMPSEIVAVDLERLLKAENLEANQLLKDGDAIFVPQAQRRVLVLGQVARPGAYDFKPGARLLDAIALAGGSTDKAALESVKVFRAEDITQATELDLGRDKLLFEGDVKLNPPLADGQIIYVPEAKEKLDWNKLIQYLSGVKLLHDLIKNW